MRLEFLLKHIKHFFPALSCLSYCSRYTIAWQIQVISSRSTVISPFPCTQFSVKIKNCDRLFLPVCVCVCVSVCGLCELYCVLCQVGVLYLNQNSTSRPQDHQLGFPGKFVEKIYGRLETMVCRCCSCDGPVRDS